MNIENDVWLDRLEKKTPVRKCGHCHKTGHTLWDCEEVQMLWDRLYMEMVMKFEENPHGYKLESFIESLTVPYLKIVYKMMCKKTMKKKGVAIYDDILEAFKVLNPGYPGKYVRRVRLYENAYRVIQQDVNTNQHGHSLQNHLSYLSREELRELTCKIGGDYKDWIGRRTYMAIYMDAIENPGIPLREIMDNASLHIHCHFSEMGFGYHFNIHEFAQHSPRAIEALLLLNQGGRKTLQMNKMDRGLSKFSKTVNLEEAGLTLTEKHIDCAVCIESKPDKQYVQFNCSHEFCGSCVGHVISTAMTNERDIVCPLCRTSVCKIVYKKLDVMVKMREIIIA